MVPESTEKIILNVNDDEAARYVVTRILQKARFRVLEAATGGEALRLAQAKPDLIVLDVNLPDISGLEVCRRVKDDAVTASIPVLHLSASFVGSSDIAVGLEGGADAYLTQPVEPAELLATIKALLRLRQAEETALTAAEQWQTTFDAITDGVCLVNGNGHILRSNKAMADLLGHERGTINGLAFNELFANAFRDVDLPPHIRNAALAHRESVEIRVGGRWLSVVSDPVRDGDGEVTGAVYILSDITESKTAGLRQRTFLRDVLSSVTENRLCLADDAADLPAPLPMVGDKVDLLLESLSALRRRAREAAHALAFSAERWQGLETAVGEAAMNALVHAGGGQAWVCSDSQNTVQVWVEDRGKGISMDYLHRATLERGYTTAGTMGHGFWLMLQTVDRIWLLTGPSGTTIVLEQDRVAREPSWFDRM